MHVNGVHQVPAIQLVSLLVIDKRGYKMCYTLFHLGLPKLTVEPATLNVIQTEPAKFSTTVIGVGKETFSYQWKHNGSDLTRETGSTLEITDTTVSHGGRYECVISNKLGDCDTSAAQLIVSG